MTKRYGTFQEIANMDLGVTGTIRTINDAVFEMVVSDEAYGWVLHGYDANGELVQVDPVSEQEAETAGLIARRFGYYDTDIKDEGSYAHFNRYIAGDR